MDIPPPPPPPNGNPPFDISRDPDLVKALGGTVFGTVFSFYLLGILTMQLATYYHRFPNDLRALKVIVASLGVTEYVHCGLLAHTIYAVGVADWGKPDVAVDHPPKSLAVSLTLSILTDTILQSYLTLRMHMLSTHRYLSVLLWLLILARFALTLFLTVEVYVLDSWGAFKHGWGWVMVGVVAMSPVIDAIIAGGLFRTLKKRSRGLSASTMGMIRMLIQWTVVNGVITTIAGLCTLALFITAAKNEKLTIGIYSILHGFFAVSFMVSLNRRTELRRQIYTTRPGSEIITTLRTASENDTTSSQYSGDGGRISPIRFTKPPSLDIARSQEIMTEMQKPSPTRVSSVIWDRTGSLPHSNDVSPATTPRTVEPPRYTTLPTPPRLAQQQYGTVPQRRSRPYHLPRQSSGDMEEGKISPPELLRGGWKSVNEET